MTTENKTGKILAVSPIKEYQGKLSIGFKINDTWFNAKGSEDQLEALLKNIIIKGSEISFEWDPMAKDATDFKILKEAEKQDAWQDDMISFEDLLSAGHKAGLMHVKSEMITIDFKERTAVFKVTVTDKEGKTFEAHGDSSIANVKADNIQIHFLRMAETRALARALRFMTNNAQVADVELRDKKEVIKKK